MHALVTGGAGFIGSHVARHLLSGGHAVTVLDDLSGGFPDQIPAGAEFVEGSILDVGLIDTLFGRRRFTQVFHLAAYAAEGLSHFVRRFNYTQNVVGSMNLVNAAVRHEVQCFVYASSIAVYGRAPVPMHEGMVPSPVDPYGIAKYAVEQDLRAAAETFGLPFVVVRPHNVYGEHQNIGDRYRNVIGIFMRQAMAARPLTIVGDGLQTRAFSHVDDVAPYIVRAATTPEARGEAINLGADTPYTVLQIAEIVSRTFGRPLQLERLPERANEPHHAYSSHEKARRILGAHAAVSLEEGIERMAAWAKTVPARVSRLDPRIEIERGLPPHWRS